MSIDEGRLDRRPFRGRPEVGEARLLLAVEDPRREREPLPQLGDEGVAVAGVDLPGKTLKFRVDPQLVASLEGQGGKTDLQGLGVPVMIAGPWAKPSIYPDIEGILKDPVAAHQQLNRLGGGLVSLPGAGNTGSVSAIGGLIKNGKVGTDALKQGALGGIGALLGNQQPEATRACAGRKGQAEAKAGERCRAQRNEEEQEAASRRGTERSSPRSGKPAPAELPRQLGGH